MKTHAQKCFYRRAVSKKRKFRSHLIALYRCVCLQSLEVRHTNERCSTIHQASKVRHTTSIAAHMRSYMGSANSLEHASTLRMKLQPGIRPFPVLGCWGKNTMAYARIWLPSEDQRKSSCSFILSVGPGYIRRWLELTRQWPSVTSVLPRCRSDWVIAESGATGPTFAPPDCSTAFTAIAGASSRSFPRSE